MSAAGRVLIVEDDAHVAEVLETMLEVRGFAVDVVTDGIHALDPGHDYDAILLDMKMPVFDGERLAGYWRITRPELLKKVIVLSGYSLADDVERFPTFATVLKPFEIEELMEIIRSCAELNGARESE